ncbi:MAG: hypothetical protein JWM28_722, partial [Chitinophagaceae bacterium]|nr:hypothetical protein [Chitinophagaceae bacterium]
MSLIHFPFLITSKKRISFFGFTILLLLHVSDGFSQNNPEQGLPFITNYSAKTFGALPQTWAVVEDNRGIMYFGVQGTILEFDGVKWRKIALPPGGIIARSFTKDSMGRIYYGAVGDFGYLGKDSLGQTITVSLLKYIPPSKRQFFDVWTVYPTPAGIFFQSREYIFLLNAKNELKSWSPKTKFMYAFYNDGNYFVHEQGIGLLQLKNDSLELIPGSEFLGQERMHVMLPYSPSGITDTGKRQYLVGMFYSGLFIFDGKTFLPFTTEADGLIKSSTLYKAVRLANGNYALSTTGKGLAIIDNDGKILQLLNRGVGLQDESVYAVYPDSKGTLWLALDNGISRVEMSSPLSQFTSQSGISTSTLSMMRYNGVLYTGTTNGLLRFNEKDKHFENVSRIPQNQTFTLVKDNNSMLVANDGLFSIRNDKTSLLRPSIGGDLQLSGLFVSKHYPNLLFGGATFGV